MGTAWDEQKQSQCGEAPKPLKHFLKGRLTGGVQVNLIIWGLILFQISPVSFKSCNIFFYIST